MELGETLRSYQRFHQWLDQEKNFETDLSSNVLRLMEEVGEMTSQVLRLRKALRPDQAGNPAFNQAAIRVALGEELADCLAFLLKIANYAQIDLQESYARKMAKNMERVW